MTGETVDPFMDQGDQNSDRIRNIEKVPFKDGILRSVSCLDFQRIVGVGW